MASILSKKHAPADGDYLPYTPLDFEKANFAAEEFARRIEACMPDLIDILLKYESYEVAHDEVNRTLDLLHSLSENKEYFKLRIGEVTAFLPRNQPLYAFTCFVVIPSLMASSAHFRIPHSMRHFFPDILSLLDVEKQFPNIIVSKLQRIEFLTERSALRVDPASGETRPVTDAVIFTGLPLHADQLRLVYDNRTLFISNGAGHNPIVVSNDADLDSAVEAATTLQFYNQGQDCAAPNAVLVHKDIHSAFLKKLRETIKAIKIGYYFDRSCRVGPISDPDDLVRIQEFLCEHSTWLDPSTPGVIETRDAIVVPSIITKPLSKGGNFYEIFAPIMFVQEYEKDAELGHYFEDKKYAQNAMYVTLYGQSDYIQNLIDREINGKVLHTKESFLHNIHLHVPGVERGTCQYGGYGYGASSISINGATIPMPTLPQRDIYEYVAKPHMKLPHIRKQVKEFTEIETKNIQKILRLHQHKDATEENNSAVNSGPVYLDTHLAKISNVRYAEIHEEDICRVLGSPNSIFIASLARNDRNDIILLQELLNKKLDFTQDKFTELLYEIPKKGSTNAELNLENQKRFFKNIYQLLFGKESGPKLTQFLYEADINTLKRLLDV